IGGAAEASTRHAAKYGAEKNALQAFRVVPDVGVPQRFDVGRLENVKKTPQGGLRSQAFVSKTGVFVYDGAKGVPIREYRPPEEVFHADSLATLPDAPITAGHPGLVSPDNFQDHAVGHVREA